MPKQKFYVVWKGRKTGIFNSWDECKTQIDGFSGAEYKSFKTRQTAESAYYPKNAPAKRKQVIQKQIRSNTIILDSISVDGAWGINTDGAIEYKGVNTATKEILFKSSRYANGTNNIAEFLAIVHALAYCKQNNLTIPVYSDSYNAISWVKAKQARTNLRRRETNKKVFELLDRAHKWLNENTYSNMVLKWETKRWGEVPADFNRK